MKNSASIFTSSDWDCWSGAEEWDNGCSPAHNLPISRQLEIGCFVVDPNGVDFFAPNGDDCYRMEIKFPTQASALAFLNGINIESFEPKEFGFIPYHQ